MRGNAPIATLLLTTSVLAVSHAAPAWSQVTAEAGSNTDIIVTARRVEERLQDVPISISVLSQDTLARNNISNPKDIAALTPGLQVNNRFGSDATNFSIRGFTQEQRTTATVGVYFADVVAPRGSGSSFGGEGSAPGTLFDLENIQVLKGPQGTLQGRNATGGAVLIVPKKPTGDFEGYLEGSLGDYDLIGLQGVVNLPVAETVRLRLGFDHMQRDGFLRNIGNFGDGRFGNKGMGNVHYYGLRASLVIDVTPDIENYTIGYYSKSKSNGVLPTMIRCFPGASAGGVPFGDLACDQLARENQFDPWTVSNRFPDHHSTTEQWQVVNTTTWQAADSLTVKNIIAYAEFRGSQFLDVFGNYFVQPGVPAGTETRPGQVTGFAFSASNPYTDLVNAQSTFVEEFRLNGHAFDERLIWQGGVYAEISKPLGFSGTQSSTISGCDDIAVRDCEQIPGFSIGRPQLQLGATKFTGYAVYGQASYNITDQLKFTAGLRYTWDKVTARYRGVNFNVATPAVFGCTNVIGTGISLGTNFPVAGNEDDLFSVCEERLRKSSSAPTWTVGLDYKPIEDILLYAKWSRGYRQGGLALFGPDTTQAFDEEKVDAYEVGAKTSWRGAVPGSFNIAAYYNDFTDQQLLLGVLDLLPNPPGVPPGNPNAAVVNAGKSRLYGFEAELNVEPFEGFRFHAAYAYLNTKIQEFIPPTFPPSSPYDTAVSPVLGGVIPNSQPHKVILAADYTLPLPEVIGEVSFGGTFVYTAAYQAVNDATPGTGFGRVPSTSVLNLNVNWEAIGGMPVDASFFITNVTNEVVFLNANDSSNRGFITSLLGEPRMWGVRLKYRFGN
jgi:iron complex outermembrane recepter protein